MKGVHALIVVLLLAAQFAGAGAGAPAAQDPFLEKRVMALAEELRCLVCQNQSLADSNAELAIDLRNRVREKMTEGLTNQQIVEYMVERYGEFVLYRPPLKATTVILWFAPFLFLVAGLAVLFHRLARRRAVRPVELTTAQRERAAALLGSRDRARNR